MMKLCLRVRTGLVALSMAAALACGPTPVPNFPSLDQARRDVSETRDVDDIGRLALLEMTAVGGTKEGAARALARIPADAVSLWAALSEAVHHRAKGNPSAAADALVRTLRASAVSREPSVELVAWFAARELLAVRSDVPRFWLKHESSLTALVRSPGNMGFRALAELGNIVAAEQFARADGAALLALRAARVEASGCATVARFFGPFGRGSASERQKSFVAERPGPWPAFVPGDGDGSPPARIVPARHDLCTLWGHDRDDAGIYYAEVFFTSPVEQEILVSSQGALSIWVDDRLVLRRDPAEFGSWHRFFAKVRVSAGRHRFLAKTAQPSTSIRLLEVDGRPLPTTFDTDGQLPYETGGVLASTVASPLEPFVTAGRAPGPVLAYLASYLAHVEGMSDVAAVLIAPHVGPSDSAALSLEAAGLFAAHDPAKPKETRASEARRFSARAVDKDSRLVAARVSLLTDETGQRDLNQALSGLTALVKEFPDVAWPIEALASTYARGGMHAERALLLEQAVQRFPDNPRLMREAIDALDRAGRAEHADALTRRLGQLLPDSEFPLERALRQGDFARARGEWSRLSARPSRGELSDLGRKLDWASRVGDTKSYRQYVQELSQRKPGDPHRAFLAADQSLASGVGDALRLAMVDVELARQDKEPFLHALELVERAVAMEPYRIDPRAVISEYEAWERGGGRMDGHSARVLDYAALRVRSDGSSEMLEHEIQKMTTEEGVRKEAEIRPPEGVLLRLRVLKPDGRTLEPEVVRGKPTLHFPHLAVGDYIEMERVIRLPRDGLGGERYQSPHWFFREADKGYWRSEFVAIVPSDKKLVIERRGPLGTYQTNELPGGRTAHRFRVDLSPAATLEPHSPPIAEFLPTVRVGWGITLKNTFERLLLLAVDDTPIDPRIVALAKMIVRKVEGGTSEQKERALFRWVLDNIRPGEETDPRRVLLGRAGSLQSAFLHLCRVVGLPAHVAFAPSALVLPPEGPMSQLSAYEKPMVALGSGKERRFVTLANRYVPFGWVPADLRGQSAVVVADGLPEVPVGQGAVPDESVYEGRLDVRRNGSATGTITITMSGQHAMARRAELDGLGAGKHTEWVERHLLLPIWGAVHARKVDVYQQTEPDQPLVVKVTVDIPELVRDTDNASLLKPPMPVDLSALATLPKRLTPLVKSTSDRIRVRIDVVLHESLRAPDTLPQSSHAANGSSVLIRDDVRGQAIHFERIIDLPRVRVPVDQYAGYAKFLSASEAHLDRAITVTNR